MKTTPTSVAMKTAYNFIAAKGNDTLVKEKMYEFKHGTMMGYELEHSISLFLRENYPDYARAAEALAWLIEWQR